MILVTSLSSNPQSISHSSIAKQEDEYSVEVAENFFLLGSDPTSQRLAPVKAKVRAWLRVCLCVSMCVCLCVSMCVMLAAHPLQHSVGHS